jgi:predicted alternative tryptophan synthase beta-subunit
MGRNRIESQMDELPNKWYNILSDLPEPLPPTYPSKTEAR